jgi:hypothetical protein
MTNKFSDIGLHIIVVITLVISGCGLSGTPANTPTPPPQKAELTATSLPTPTPIPGLAPMITPLPTFPAPPVVGLYFLIDISNSTKMCEPSSQALRHQISAFAVSLLHSYGYNQSWVGIKTFPKQNTTVTGGLQPLSTYLGADFTKYLKEETNCVGCDGFGYANALNQAFADFKQHKNMEKKIVVLITDGLFGSDERNAFENSLTSQERGQTEVIALLLQCKTKPDNVWFRWDSDADTNPKKLLELFLQDGSGINFFKKIQEALLPVKPVDNETGWGWFDPRGEPQSTPDNTNGDTSQLNIQVISPLGSEPGFVEMDGNSKIPLDPNPNSDHAFIATIPMAPTNKAQCNEKNWKLHGPADGFYTWNVNYPSWSLSVVPPEQVINNEPFSITVTLSTNDLLTPSEFTDRLSNFDLCYEIQLKVTDKEGKPFKGDGPVSLDSLVHASRGGAVTWVEPIESYELSAFQTIGIYAQLVRRAGNKAAMAQAFKGIPAIFHPTLADKAQFNSQLCEKCTFTITLPIKYGAQEYYPEDFPSSQLEPKFYFITHLSRPELDRRAFQGKNCEPFYPLASEQLQVNAPADQQFYGLPLDKIEERLTGNSNISAPVVINLETAKRAIRNWSIQLFADRLLQKDVCNYEGLIVQWPDHPDWPAIYCDLNQGICEHESRYQVTNLVRGSSQ